MSQISSQNNRFLRSTFATLAADGKPWESTAPKCVAEVRISATPSRLPLTRQPDRVPATVRVFRNMGHNIKAIPVEQ
jgi:hypothetical protein